MFGQVGIQGKTSLDVGGDALVAVVLDGSHGVLLGFMPVISARMWSGFGLGLCSWTICLRVSAKASVW